MRLALTPAFAVAAALIAGCGAGDDSTELTQPESREFIEKLAFGPPESNSCKHRNVKRSVERFLSGASRGDRAGLEASLVDEPLFRVFSTGYDYGSGQPERFFASRNREQVVEKLLSRRVKGDRYSLRTVDANNFDRSRHLCGFGFTIDRRIEGGPWRGFVGKGALDSRTRTIAVWNVGGLVPG